MSIKDVIESTIPSDGALRGLRNDTVSSMAAGKRLPPRFNFGFKYFGPKEYCDSGEYVLASDVEVLEELLLEQYDAVVYLKSSLDSASKDCKYLLDAKAGAEAKLMEKLGFSKMLSSIGWMLAGVGWALYYAGAHV